MNRSAIALMSIMFLFSFAPIAIAQTVVGGEIGASANPGGGTPATPNSAPPAPNLTTPVNNSNLTIVNVTFSWQSVVDPDGDMVSYRLDVDTASNFENRMSVATSMLQEMLPLTNNTHFYWRVGSWDGHNLTFSVVREFTIGTLGGQTDNPQPMTAPILLQPANQAVVNESPVMSWQTVAGATGYTLMIWRSGYATSLTKNLTTTSYNTTPDNLTEGAYLWKVKAFSLTQESVYSSERSFTLNLTSATNETDATESHYCGDNTCDTGESCSNCAADCGACPVTTETTSSGGGGGGGGGGSTTTTTTTNTTPNTTVEEPETYDEPVESSIIIEDNTTENETQDDVVEQPSGIDLTGFVSGIAPYTVYIIVAFVAVAGVALFLTRFGISWA